MNKKCTKFVQMLVINELYWKRSNSCECWITRKRLWRSILRNLLRCAIITRIVIITSTSVVIWQPLEPINFALNSLLDRFVMDLRQHCDWRFMRGVLITTVIECCVAGFQNCVIHSPFAPYLLSTLGKRHISPLTRKYVVSIIRRRKNSSKVMKKAHLRMKKYWVVLQFSAVRMRSITANEEHEYSCCEWSL